MTFEITTISSKGQIVIPSEIRKELHIEEGTKFAVITDGENLLLKKVEPPSLKQFNELIRDSRSLARKKGITKANLRKLIAKNRKKSRT